MLRHVSLLKNFLILHTVLISLSILSKQRKITNQVNIYQIFCEKRRDAVLSNRIGSFQRLQKNSCHLCKRLAHPLLPS